MKQKIIYSLNHLKQLNDDPFTLQKVAYWLYEYNNLYKSIKKDAEIPCGQCQEWKDEGLPYDCLQKPEYCTKKHMYFTDFYEGVEYGVNVQELDNLCKVALAEYSTITGDLQLKEWVIKYFDIGYNKLAIFYYDHLDYSVNNDEVIHPHFGNSPIGEFGVFINRKYYENIIEFEDIFKTLLYEKKVYPEKLKEIEREMEKIAIPMIPLPKID